MKKPYILFAVGLVVLILAFTFTQSYLTKLEDDTKSSISKPVTQSELDDLREEVGQKLSEQQEHFLARLDSLEQRIRTGVADDTISVKPIVETRHETPKPAATSATAAEPVTAESTTSALSSLPPKPSELENAIYGRYLKQRWALAPNMTSYELNIAKNDIMTEIGKDYEMTAEEILQVIDKVYEYRKAIKNQ